MSTVRDIYAEYHIIPVLQLHQLRVATVGKKICEHFSVELDKRSVILACLFHDMGNIIKFDLSLFPQFLEPDGKEYWQRVKDEWIQAYGPDEHAASNVIARKIGLPETVRALIDNVRFSRLEAARDTPVFEEKIVKYADLRVSPFRICSMNERLTEGHGRYLKKKGYDTLSGRERYERLSAAAREIEQQIFARCSIKPENITEESVRDCIVELQNYPVA